MKDVSVEHTWWLFGLMDLLSSSLLELTQYYNKIIKTEQRMNKKLSINSNSIRTKTQKTSMFHRKQTPDIL